MRSSGVYFSELRLRLKSILAARATWMVVLVLLAIQLLVTIAGGHETLMWLFTYFGLSRSGVAGGGIWQLVTYGLLHGGFLHVGINALCIVMIGGRVEHVLGERLMLKTLLAGVIGGGIAHLMLDSNGPLVGISGGCVGLLILLTALSPDSRMWPIPVSARSMGIGVMAAELILAVVGLNLDLPGFSHVRKLFEEVGFAGENFTIGHACHFGGGMAGFLMGLWLLRPRVDIATLRRERERREARKIKPDGV